MRQGHNNGLLFDDNGRVCAVNLGADHCAEHEWGIEGIDRHHGRGDKSKFGLDRRRATKCPDHLVWHEGTVDVRNQETGRNRKVKYAGFWSDDGRRYCSDPSKREPYELAFYRGTLWTAWCKDSFAAFSIDEKEIAHLREVYEAQKSCNAVIWLGGGGVFQNAGLVVGIVDRIDPKVYEQWDITDRERAQLEADAAATGIADRLKAAGKSYFALSPSRDKDGTVSFWLNPMEQDRNNYGQYTVAELDAWIAGTGPIPITAAQMRKRRERW